MPVYICNSVRGTINDAAKPMIAADITRIHCEVTGAPPQFVHAFFLEEAPHLPLEGKSAVLRGSIRSGRADTLKTQIVTEMGQSIQRHAGLKPEAVYVNLVDVPSNWAMEGGEVMPEPGEEAEWLARHRTTHSDGSCSGPDG